MLAIIIAQYILVHKKLKWYLFIAGLGQEKKKY